MSFNRNADHSQTPCALCQAVAPLQRSHLISAGFYRIISNYFADAIEPAPVLVGGGAALYSNKQFQRPLLCSGCEQLQQSRGEKTMLHLCRRSAHVFPLREAMLNVTPGRTEKGRGIFRGSDLAHLINVEAITYFAATIIWRASIVDWGLPDKGTFGALGKKYEECFRRYLAGMSSFPPNADVHVFVDCGDLDFPAMHFPTSARLAGRWQYTFVLPGTRFIVLVGGHSVGATSSGFWPITFYEWKIEGTDFLRAVAAQVQSSKPKGKLTATLR